MNKKQLTSMVIVVLILLVGVMSVSFAQGQGRGQGRGQGGGQGGGQGCGSGGECMLPFEGPMDGVAMIGDKLAIAIEDEYHAKAVYADVIDQFGDVRPFSNIINAEQRHIEALSKLYEKYGLEVMEDPYEKGTFEFADLKAAAQASVDAEITNADLYDDLLVGVTDPDVIAVFEKLQWASRERHLPAFERYLENGGQGGGQGNGKGRSRRGGGGGQGRGRR